MSKRINLLWRDDDWARLIRVREKLGETSDSATLRRALQIAEAVVDGEMTCANREVVLPT